MKNLFKKKKRIIINTTCILFLAFLILFAYGITDKKGISFSNVTVATIESKDHIYISDLDYITANNWSHSGWKNIEKNRNTEGKTITLRVNGEIRPFIKGMGLHSKGQLTYNISELSTKYTRFVAKVGVDGSRTDRSNLAFEFLYSDDGETWESITRTENLTFSSESVDIDIPIEGHKYLRIYVDPNGKNDNDHAVLANAMLVTEDYVFKTEPYDRIKKLDYYDNILGGHLVEDNYENNYNLVLERELVRKLGYYLIQDSVVADSSIANTLDWILDDTKVFEQVIEVGEISDTFTFLNIIDKLYNKYKDAFASDDGFVYQKMIIALAAGYSTDIILSPLRFNSYTRTYDPFERYDLYKQLYDNDKLFHKDWFQNYHIELFRMIMQDGVKNDELFWLNNFITQYKKRSLNPYNYMNYRYHPNYSQPPYYDINNKATYENKYHLEAFNVPFAQDNNARYWMVFEYGGICWNISRVGTSLNRTVGIPSTGSYQPGHEVYYEYGQNANGDGYWNLGNDVFGWGKTSTRWYGGNRYRLIFNWGAKYFSNEIINNSNTGTSSGYMYLGQANLNNLEVYRKSYYYNLIANSYSNDESKLNTYNKALAINNLNLDSYDYKINMYKRLSKSSAEWKDLALDIINAYTYYPNAMVDILKVIKPYITDDVDYLNVQIAERAALQAAQKATSNEVLQYGACRQLANVLLGKEPDTEIATFSFTGTNAHKIVFKGAYAERNFGWQYTLDGGATFSNTITEHSYELSKEELESISDVNDIGIAIVGLGSQDADYIIPIGKNTLSSNLYANDLENRVIGINLNYEWRNSETDEWTSYAVASPNNTGNKTLYVRLGATGNNIPSDSVSYTFTEDNQTETRKYIPVSHLSVAGYISQSRDTNRPFYAPNAIDANLRTMWHTDFAINVLKQPTKPFYTIKLDAPKYISALEFAQFKYRDADPAFIKNARVYVSEDGEEWKLAGSITNCPKNTALKSIDFEDSVYGDYVKIEMDTYDMFASLAIVNLYEDTTKIPPEEAPTANVGYSITRPTNGNVVARLVNPSKEIKILNNNGSDTYTFTENNSFTFEFIDKNCTNDCKVGTVTATVDWIDRVAPTGTIKFNTTDKVNGTVTATLVASEDVIVTNNGEYRLDYEGNIINKEGQILEGYTVDDEGNIKDANGNVLTNINTFTHDFTENGDFTFEFMDLAGNRGSTTATVNWIDHEAPVATLNYDITGTTNKDVKVTVTFNEEAVVTNNNGSKSYVFKENGEFTFEFRDLAGNRGSITAKVHWIDKVAPTAKLKVDKQKDQVVVVVVDPSEEIVFPNNGTGIYTYIYNGTYEITFTDKAGNVGKLTVVVDTLKNRPNPKPDDNKPTNPDDNKPNDPTKPDDKPTTPDNNKPNDNKPTTPGNKPTKPVTNKPNNDSVNVDYKKFVDNNIIVDIPSKYIKNGMSLKVTNFALNSELKSLFGDASTYYDISFSTNGKTIDVNTTEPMKISIKREGMKQFLGAYEITKDNIVKLIDYSINGENIEITTSNVGKIVLSYKELKAISPSITIPVIGSEKNNNSAWVAASLGVITIGGAAYIIYKRKGI